MAKRIQRTVKRPTGEAPRPQAEGRQVGRPTGRRVSRQAVTEFTIQMSTLVEAGIPVVRALSILHGQARPGPFKEVLAELVEDVSAGTPLSEAMEKHGRAFDELYSAMVRAGETGGVLDRVLTRLAQFREQAAEIRAKVVGAMIYPVVVISVAIVVVTLVMILVIPRFQDVFQSFGIALPGPTQLLLSASEIATRYWYVVIGAPIGLLLLHWSLMRRAAGYRFFWHRAVLKIPYLGPVLRQSLIASFSRTFGTLVQAGVPHLDALAITRDTLGNDVHHAAVEEIRRTVREGETIARPMGESGAFDDLVVNMVDVGEQTGELDRMLLRVADAYEVQTSRRIDALFKILEPALIIALAAFVGFIVVSLFLPLLKIMSTVGGR